MAELGRRLVWAAFIVWAVVSLTFVINNVLPTDPARMIAGPQSRPADVARIRQQLGLDRPLHIQYGAFLQARPPGTFLRPDGRQGPRDVRDVGPGPLRPRQELPEETARRRR